MEREPEGEYSTVVVATVLILALGFAGYWIWAYAATGSPPWNLAGWFAGAAVLSVIGGFVLFQLRGRR